MADETDQEPQPSGATATAGPGTPDYYFAVGGKGDPVLHPETGEPVLNPQSGYPIIQEHPRDAAEQRLASARAQLASVEGELERMQAEVAAAEAEVAAADAQWDEIVAGHVARAQAAGE